MLTFPADGMTNVPVNSTITWNAVVGVPGYIISIGTIPGGVDILNQTNVERDIRTMEVSKLVSRISEISEVRKKLVEQQQVMGAERGLVMDGRDIGTVVFPDAELKLFMTASPEKRATRRYKELLDKGHKVSYAEVLENVQQRDFMDSTRKDSPLVKAKDAVEFDNSDMGLKEQFERVYNLALLKISKA